MTCFRHFARRPWFRRGLFIALWSGSALSGHNLHAQNPNDLFQTANTLFYASKFSDAASVYEKLLAISPASPTLYFNLGNAWFKAGQLGRAIAAYRQAEQLTPRDPDIRANLQFARNQRQGPSFSFNPAQRALARLTLNEWTLLASVALWIWFILLILLQWRPAWKKSARVWLVVLGLATLGLCCCVALAHYQYRAAPIAVVIAREASVRQGPLDEAKTLFTVHDGAELRVLDRKDEWFQVTTDPRRLGWIHRNEVLVSR